MGKTITTIYRSEKNDDFGVSIIEKITKKGSVFEVWTDEFEGGDASDTDWTYVDDFGSEDAALSFIFEEYGPVYELE